jgi:hypothetical protein
MKHVVSALMVSMLAGCASSGSSDSASPVIQSVTTAEQKRIPFGSSDTAEPYTPLREAAADAGYGYEPGNPIKVGGVRFGPSRERAFLNALRGPSNEIVVFERRGACCPFETPNGYKGSGVLDAFEVKHSGLREPVVLYLDIYDEGPLMVPVGFVGRFEQP